MVFGHFDLRINKIVLSLKVQWYCIKWEVGRGFSSATTVGTCSSVRYYNPAYVTVPRASNCAFLLSILGCCCVCSMKSSIGFLISLMQFYYFYQKKKKEKRKKTKRAHFYILKRFLPICPILHSTILLRRFQKNSKTKMKRFYQWFLACHVWAASSGKALHYLYCNSMTCTVLLLLRTNGVRTYNNLGVNYILKSSGLSSFTWKLRFNRIFNSK